VKRVTIKPELTAREAAALAQFLKRVGFYEVRVNAVDDAECYLIRDALDEVRNALASAGYAPR
jgi:hypothetical protein